MRRPNRMQIVMLLFSVVIAVNTYALWRRAVMSDDNQMVHMGYYEQLYQYLDIPEVIHNSSALLGALVGKSTILSDAASNNDELLAWSKFHVDRPFPQKIPQLNELIDDGGAGWNIQSDVRWMLDFAVIGFPKCGTTTMLKYLQTDGLWTAPKEWCELGWNRSAPLLRKLYNHQLEGDVLHNEHVKKGMKCPSDVENPNSLDNFGWFFNTTKFIVGVRHPVLWFQSFYNFRLSQGVEIQSSDGMTGACFSGMQSVCADRCRYDAILGAMGKTELTEEEISTMSIVGRGKTERDFRKTFKQSRKQPNKIFLYDVAQLHDGNETRTVQFRRDLQRYLGSTEPLPPLIKISPNLGKSDKKIDICDAKHNKIRSELVYIGSKASRWIREYFLQSEDVFVSSRYYFEESLRLWETDPCSNKS